MIENVAVDNLIFLCQGVFNLREVGLWNGEQGTNWLDGGAPFYSIYRAKDKGYFSVAPIEPKFYRNFLGVLKEKGLSENDYEYLKAHQV